MKKILLSLAIIGIVAGITLGVTGAWWSDSALSHNTSFSSGNLDLELSNSYASSGLSPRVDQTWDQTNMEPGGAPLEAILYMKNVGSIDADHMSLAVVNTPSGIPGYNSLLDDHMRITKLDYGLHGQGMNSLLIGGAGADFSDYQAPTYCDVIVSSEESIQAKGIDTASVDDTVCVGAGTYVENVDVDKDITLVALNSPLSGSKTIVTGIIDVSAAGATVKGLRVDKLVVSGQEAAITVTASDVTIDSNVVYNMTGDGTETIKGIHVYANEIEITNITLTNNWIEKIYDTGKGSVGIMVQGHLNGVTVTHNTIKDITSNNSGTPTWDYATGIEDTPTGSGYIGSPLNIVVTDNHIEDIVSVVEPGRGFSVDAARCITNYAYAGQVTFTRNNIVNVVNPITNKDPRPNVTLNAQGNWFGSFTPIVNVNGSAKCEVGSVDTTNYAGNAFVGFINGVDSNANGYADLADFQTQGINNVNPGLAAGQWGDLYMAVQLDGPTTDNNYQGGTLGMDMTVIMNQGPAN